MQAPLSARPTSLHDAYNARRHYVEKVARGVALEDVLDPKFWSHVASQFREFDQITIVAEDKSWWGLFMVVSAGTREARLMQLGYAAGMAQKKMIEPDVEVRFRGVRKFGLVRIADGAVIEEDIPTKEEAMARLAARMAA